MSTLRSWPIPEPATAARDSGGEGLDSVDELVGGDRPLGRGDQVVEQFSGRVEHAVDRQLRRQVDVAEQVEIDR